MTERQAGETDEQLAKRFIHELDDNFLYCRANRRHRFPVVLPPKKGKPIRLPRGVSISPAPNGCFQKEETCEICGRVVITTTLPGGYTDRKAVRRYQDPAGYAAPKGTGKHLQGSAAADELDRRLVEGGLFGMPGQ